MLIDGDWVGNIDTLPCTFLSCPPLCLQSDSFNTMEKSPDISLSNLVCLSTKLGHYLAMTQSERVFEHTPISTLLLLVLGRDNLTRTLA